MDTYTKEGVVIELKDTVKFNDWFSKREFKIRYTEQDISNKIVEQKIKLVAQDNETIEALDGVRVDDQVKVIFYITGKDVAKKDNPEIIMNFTTLVPISIEVMGSPTRDTKADKEAVITKEAKVYRDPLAPATDEQLAGIVTSTELEGIWDKKKDKYGLNEDTKYQGPNTCSESMKSKIFSKEEDPFSDLQEIGPNGEEIKPLPF